MSDYPLEVTASGAVLLGPKISCDGFHYDSPIRVQTHVHADHMTEFDASKGNQHIVTSMETHALLVTELNADIPYRQNIVAVDTPGVYVHEDTEVTLVGNGHMLGAVQVAVDAPGMPRLGYSGDFQWPLDRAIDVEGLVLDSTYGSPSSRREYTQDHAEERLLQLVADRLRFGAVNVLAHRGTLQRALQVLCGNVDCPLLGTTRLCAEVGVYQRFGYPVAIESRPERDALSELDRYVMFYGTGDGKPIDPEGSTITLSAYMTRPDDPVLRYSDRAYRVALSNHADFEGTLAYVEATGASYVVTDNTRGRGVELAEHISARLGVEAHPSTGRPTLEWGA